MIQRIIWDKNREEEVRRARGIVKELHRQGYEILKLDGTILEKFDPALEEVTMECCCGCGARTYEDCICKVQERVPITKYRKLLFPLQDLKENYPEDVLISERERMEEKVGEEGAIYYYFLLNKNDIRRTCVALEKLSLEELKEEWHREYGDMIREQREMRRTVYRSGGNTPRIQRFIHRFFFGKGLGRNRKSP